MEPDTKDREFMYRLIIGQLYFDGHNQLALDLSNSIAMNPFPYPSDKLFLLVSVARENADQEKKEADMQMSLSPVVSSMDSLAIEEDYFPILSLPSHILDNIFSVLSIEDRLALARAKKILNKIESESKYYVESLVIIEMPFIGAPSHPFIEHYFNEFKHWIILFENKSYSSDFMRRIAHNASIGNLVIQLSGSSEFHREVYDIIKEIDIGELHLKFENMELEKETMVESFVLGLARSCKDLVISLEHVTAESIHKLYEILLDGSTKLRSLYYCDIKKDKCNEFLQFFGITYRGGTLFSNRKIEVYKVDCDEDHEDWYKLDRFHVFGGNLEMIITSSIFEKYEEGYFDLIRHADRESLEKAKNEEGRSRIEIFLE